MDSGLDRFHPRKLEKREEIINNQIRVKTKKNHTKKDGRVW